MKLVPANLLYQVLWGPHLSALCAQIEPGDTPEDVLKAAVKNYITTPQETFVVQFPGQEQEDLDEDQLRHRMSKPK